MAADEKSPVSRGFVGRRRSSAQAERVPPGQYVTLDFPILSAGPTPHTPLEQWSFALQQGTQRLAEWNWSQFQALKQTQVTVDIHCVTKWSKLDTRWLGVTFDSLLEAAGLGTPPTAYVMAYSDGGYTTNLLVADLLNGQALIVTKFDDAPLPVLVASSPTTSYRVTSKILGPLLDMNPDERDMLLDTLAAFFQFQGSAVKAGKYLYCHPNTVRHRLHRIERQTGRSLKNPKSSAELFVAMEALRRLPEQPDGTD